MDLGIRNRVALVTASSAGLGFATAKALSMEGARVALCGRTRETLDRAAETIRTASRGEVVPFVADVSKVEDCTGLVKSVQETLGPIEILVNNSGGPRPGLFDAVDDEGWQAGIDSTLMNVVHLVRLVLPGMKEAGWGRIVTITSSSAKEPVGSLLMSNTLRPAVHGLTKSLARELGPFNITINTAQPGYYLTERLREVAKINAEKMGISEEEALQNMSGDTPLGRLGNPDELGEAIAFLCSERASYITGTTLLADGGRTLGTSY